jgi:hypothetical protein
MFTNKYTQLPENGRTPFRQYIYALDNLLTSISALCSLNIFNIIIGPRFTETFDRNCREKRRVIDLCRRMVKASLIRPLWLIANPI